MSDLTPDELAAELRVSRRWVIENTPRLPHYKVGRSARFTPEDVAAIKANGRDAETPDASGLTSRSRRSA